MTTVIDKLDAATETVIPTSPVYFRTIVRRDHAGYGLTVCGTNPVTVRNIREGKESVSQKKRIIKLFTFCVNE